MSTGVLIVVGTVTMVAFPLISGNVDDGMGWLVIAAVASPGLIAFGALLFRKGLFTGSVRVTDGGLVLGEPVSLLRRWGGPRWFVPRIVILAIRLRGTACYVSTTVGPIRVCSKIENNELDAITGAGYPILAAGAILGGEPSPTVDPGGLAGSIKEPPNHGSPGGAASGNSRSELARPYARLRLLCYAGISALLAFDALTMIVTLFGGVQDPRFVVASGGLATGGSSLGILYLAQKARLTRPPSVSLDSVVLPTPIFFGRLGGRHILAPRTALNVREILSYEISPERITFSTPFGLIRLQRSGDSEFPLAIERMAIAHKIPSPVRDLAPTRARLRA